MKRMVLASAVIVAGFCSHVAHAAAPADCFANPGAVFSAHPNATHAGYIVRGKRSGGSGRCWYADSFKSQAQANEKPALRSIAATGVTSTARTPTAKTSTAKTLTTGKSVLHHTIKASTPQPRATAMAPALQLRGTVMEPMPQPRAAAVPHASLDFPKQIPPAVQIAVNARELSRLSLVDESPTDFNSRFSASGYKAPK
jgi:hypothetical protein